MQKYIDELQAVFNEKPTDAHPKIIEWWEKVGPLNVQQWIDEGKYKVDLSQKIVRNVKVTTPDEEKVMSSGAQKTG